MGHQTTRRLHVHRYGVTHIDAAHFSAYRLRVEVSEAVDMDARVFVYRRDPINPYTSDVTDTFFTIASPVDLAEYPPEEPNPGNSVPFFRKNFVELDFRSTAAAEAAWYLILKELSVLLEAFDRLEDLALVEDLWLGPYPDEPFRGSVSISEPVE